MTDTPTNTELLSEAELEALDITVQLAHKLLEIVGKGPQSNGDWKEMVSALHHIQNAILAQAAARAYPEKFRLMGGSDE